MFLAAVCLNPSVWIFLKLFYAILWISILISSLSPCVCVLFWNSFLVLLLYFELHSLKVIGKHPAKFFRESIQQPRYLILDQGVRLTNKQPTYLSVPNANLAAICVTNMTIMSLQGAMYSILLHFIVVSSRRCLPVQRSWFFIIQIIIRSYRARLFVTVTSSRFLMTLE